MKKATMIAAMLAAATLGASQYYSNITNQWYSGNQTNVYNEGMARLATNQNDIAGLLMVASWKLDFCGAEAASNAMVRLAEVARTVQTTHFTNLVWLLELDNRSIFRHMGEETPQTRVDDLIKAARPGLLPHYWQFLDALDCDGYFGEPRESTGGYY